MNNFLYPVYKPSLHGNEKKYVNECLDSTWISSKGEFINRFEKSFATFIDSPWASSVFNGTVALHLALNALNIESGSEVIVPSFTYIASVNTIIQAGLTPIFVDSDEMSWQLDVRDVERKITPKTKAIMAVHLYGQSCDMLALTNLCKKNQLFLIEDCAEAFGTYYHNQHVGTFGDIATFSFFGNKTITTGEGGMVVGKDAELFKRCQKLKNQGISNTKQYWHDVIAYNYRMTNIQAALGLAQLENAPEILKRKKEIARMYGESLKDLPVTFHPEQENTVHSYWMCSILTESPNTRDPLREHLAKAGIETRPLFYPVHTMPMFSHLVNNQEQFPIASKIGACGINLPSYPSLEWNDIQFITETIRKFFN